MSVNKPRFPEEEWTGASPVRDGTGAKDARPDYEDWDQVIAELRKTQLQLIVRATAGEDLDKTNVARINSSGQLVKAQANLVDNAGSMGVIVKSTLTGNMATAQTVGTVEGFVGLSRGQLYYLDDATAGGLRTSPGTVNRLIGIGKSPTELLLLLGMGTGAQGPPGEQGEQGPPGADGADGVSITLTGAWSDITDYEINDIVSYQGSSYGCILAHTDQAPPNATYWVLLASKGDTGETGATGDPGAAGDPGADGESFNWQGTWSNVVTYNDRDVVLYTDDALYIATQTSLNSEPDSNPADWDLFLPAGVDGSNGSNGADGAGYGGTSSTSMTISTDPQTLTTQAGLAYVVGSRIRVISASNPEARWMEGIVTDYTGTTLEFNPEFTSGSGTYADWSISIAGERGIQGEQGDPGDPGADGADGLMAPGGRLTVTTGTPVPAADVNNSANLYYTPYLHNSIRLYNGSAWETITFSETAVTMPATTNTNYDVFAYNNAGTLAFETVSWSTNTARATNIVYFEGRLVKSGDSTRLYIGTGRTGASSATQTDSNARRRLFNMYNRVARVLRIQEAATSWTYNSSSWRQVNANSSNEIQVVIGVVGPVVDLKHTMVASMGDAAHSAYNGIGLDTVGNSGLVGFVEGTAKEQMVANYGATLDIGFHTLTPVERVTTTTTMTMSITNTSSEMWGILGTIEDI